MSKRHFMLEQIEGTRTYIAPPNRIIIELIESPSTVGGVILPESAKVGGGIKPLGKVLAVGRGIGEHWRDERPCQLGETVMFDPNFGTYSIHGNLVTIMFDAVALIVRMGKQDAMGHVYTPEPEPEEMIQL